ncbi:hypothetical protein [Acinetobacter pittii]|uniref:hypothetical protein n=1 Tax=Acinetobacter pittii TaxID=48296 RepID=UPI001D177D04|nr:hypothetical protein [Acinetobacter pittii]
MSNEEIFKHALAVIPDLQREIYIKWYDIPDYLRVAIQVIRLMNKEIGHSIISRGHLDFLDSKQLKYLSEEAELLKKNCLTVPKKAHRWNIASSESKKFFNSSSFQNFIKTIFKENKIKFNGKVNSNYNFYNEGELAYPHIDIEDFCINMIIMLKHNYNINDSSKLILYPMLSDPIELNLKPGDYIIFWAKTTVHARTTLKKGEEVCIMSYGFPLKNLEILNGN